MLRDVLLSAKTARVIEEAGQQQLRDDVHEARAADSHRLDVASDHLQLDPVAQGHAFDRSLGGPHAALDLTSLERRAGRSRGGERPLGAADNDLPIGADIHEDAHLGVARHAGGQNAGDDVRADVGAQCRQGLHVAVWMDVEAEHGGRHGKRLHEGGGERHHGDRRRVHAHQEVEHRHVADHHRLVGALAAHACLLVEVCRDLVHGVDDRRLKLAHRLGTVHGMADA